MSRRPGTAALVAVLIGVVLAGCTVSPRAPRPSAASEGPPSREPTRSVEQAAAAVAEVDGATARIGRAYNGTTPYLSISVTLDDTFGPDAAVVGGSTRDAEFLDYVLRQAWSQDEDSPEQFTAIKVAGTGRTVDTVTASLASLGISAFPYAGPFLSLKGEDLVARYGTWPAEVPAVPTTLGGVG
jgi:hypothetical protein